MGALTLGEGFEIAGKRRQRYTKVGDGNKTALLERQSVSLPESRIYERQTDYEEPKKATLKCLDMDQ